MSKDCEQIYLKYCRKDKQKTSKLSKLKRSCVW